MADTETKELTPDEQRAALEKQIKEAQLALERLAEPDPATMTQPQLQVAFLDHLVTLLGTPPQLEKYWVHLRPKLAPIVPPHPAPAHPTPLKA